MDFYLKAFKIKITALKRDFQHHITLLNQKWFYPFIKQFDDQKLNYYFDSKPSSCPFNFMFQISKFNVTTLYIFSFQNAFNGLK
jgi:hypothetical protein